MIRNMFDDPRQRATAIAIWVASFSAGAAIGPLVGGALLEHFWWGSVFLVPVPLMVLLLVIGPILLPEFRNRTGGRLDVISAAQSMGSILAVIYGLKQIAQGGSPGWASLAVATGLATGALFLRRQQRLDEPLLDLRLFRNTDFSAALTINVLDFFMGFGTLLFITQYLQSVLGLSPLRAGLWTVPWAVAAIVGSVLTPLCTRRAPPAFVMAAGLVVAAGGFGILTQVSGSFGLPALVAGSVLLSLGLAPLTTIATDMMVGVVVPARAGIASSVSETSSELGGALGIAVLGSIGNVAYRSHIANTVSSNVPVDVIREASKTIGGATALAERLPGPGSIELLHVARQAFVDSFALIGGICAVMAIATAVACIVLLQHPVATSADEL